MTGSRTTARLAPAAALAVAAVLAGALAAQAAFHVKLASKNSGGTPANGNSSTTDLGGALSRNGNLVAFYSQADNLPGGDGSTYEVYVRNFERGKTKLASAKNNGDPADKDVRTGAISANGRFVAFFGSAGNLPGGDGITSEVWIHDRRTDRTRLVSRANNGDPADANCDNPSVSAGGRFVAFYSSADNLPSGDGSTSFVYVRDLERGKTGLASKTNGGDPAYGQIYGQAISSSGRFVAFVSQDADLPDGDGSTIHVYLRDLERRRTRLIDRNTNGQVADTGSSRPSVSGNGRFVAFHSYADNLPGGDGTHDQVYLRDLERGKTKLVSRDNAGDPQDGDATRGHVSGNGRYVVFRAAASNLPGGDGSTNQIYGRDMRERRTRLLSRGGNGDPADSDADEASISLDGGWAAFYSDADNLGGNTSYSNAFRAGAIG